MNDELVKILFKKIEAVSLTQGYILQILTISPRRGIRDYETRAQAEVTKLAKQIAKQLLTKEEKEG